jgi:hypothetical protein
LSYLARVALPTRMGVTLAGPIVPPEFIEDMSSALLQFGLSSATLSNQSFLTPVGLSLIRSIRG